MSVLPAREPADDEFESGKSLPELLAEELPPLFEPAATALRESCLVVVLGGWQATHVAALLPFHAYLGHAPFQDLLPAHPKFGMLSFRPQDSRALEVPIYEITASLDSRRAERVRRASREPRSRSDLIPADWEQGLDRRRGRLRNLLLPASSFMQLLQVTDEGRSKRRPRPILGRMSRRGPKPTCLTHTRGTISREAAAAFATVDFLLVDIQGLRRAAHIDAIARVMSQRGPRKPTLMLAAGPSDLVPLWHQDVVASAQFRSTGPSLQSPQTHVRLVGRDRLEAEREFEFAFAGLSGELHDAKLLRLAKSAWWASRQQLTENGAALELNRFATAYDELASLDPAKANTLSFGKQLLEREALSPSVRAERREAIIDVSLSARGGQGLFILTRSWSAADALRHDLSQEGWSASDLHALGVVIRPPSWSCEERSETSVATGFFGPQTLDAVLSSRARHLYLVVDPIEVRALWFSINTILSILERANDQSAHRAVLSVREEIQRHVPAFVDDIVLNLDFRESVLRSRAVDPVLEPVERGNVAILLADGTRLDVPENARFEVANTMALKLRPARAKDLRSGDEIIVLHDESRIEFSDRLLAVIDQGPLAAAAAARQTWFEILRAARAQRRDRVKDIAEKMTSAGSTAEPASVRTWLPSPDGTHPLIPDSLEKFLAFASALRIVLPRETLMSFYAEVRRWRDGHRRCGRYLARAIRGAYAGRLDAVMLRRIERDWGMNVRHLMQAAQLATVDKVLMAEDTTDGAH